jgi:CRP-like cAMP-binding protein
VQTALSTDSWRTGPDGAVLYVIDRRKLHSLLQAGAGSRRIRAAQALQALPMLEGLTKGQLFALTDVMKRREINAGTRLSDAFLTILLKGCVTLNDRGALQRASDAADFSSEPIAGPVTAGMGDAFGEAACIASGACLADLDIVATTDAEILACDKDTFRRVLGQPEALLVPGAQRKTAGQARHLLEAAEAPMPRVITGVASLALEQPIAEGDESGILMDEDFEAAPATATALPVGALDKPLAAAPFSRPLDPAEDALLAAAPAGGLHGSRFRTPNQDVSWHGSSLVRQHRWSPLTNASANHLPHTQAMDALSHAARDALAVQEGGHALPVATPAGPSPPADSCLQRALSAPTSLHNLTGGVPRVRGAVGHKGRWRMSLCLGDFLLGSKLGEGLTGRVHYAKLKLRGLECALKIMRKTKLIELGEEQHVRSELEALGRIDSQFVTALLGCFQDTHAVYLAIEYMRGPDLFAYMCAQSSACVPQPA